MAACHTAASWSKAVLSAFKYFPVESLWTVTSTAATPLVASVAVPASVVLAPDVVLGPIVPAVVTAAAGLVWSSVIVSVAVVLTLPTASRTSRHTVFAPSPLASVCAIVPPPP